MVQEGAFRQDLYYRLNVVTLHLPPLRERREDIPLQVEHFVQKFVQANRRPLTGISQEALDLLLKYDYPGNVRELENIMERAVVISRGPVITGEDLPFGPAPAQAQPTWPAPTNLQEAVEQLERSLMQAALAQTGHNQSQAARLLGLSERMLRYKLKKYHLK